MSGSNLYWNLPEDSGTLHGSLNGRNASLQHSLKAIYRESDGKDLETILNEMSERDTSVKWELFNIDNETDTLTLTKFSFNMARDELLVSVSGIDVYEGSDKDYVKISATQIKFNYTLKAGYEVYVILAGTKSNVTFGDDIYNALNKFTQLTDVPQSYHGNSGKYLVVNESETGLVFGNAIANSSLQLLEYEAYIEASTSVDKWLSFIPKGIIKGIKIFGDNTESFTFSIWTGVNQHWVYYSGSITGVLWDIMDIPFVDESGQNCIYVRLHNKGKATNFKIQIYVVI